MNRVFVGTLLIIFVLCNGCATIFNWDNKKDLRIESSEPGTMVSIYNRGRFVEQVPTPCNYHVEAASGYMRRSSYEFVFEKEGYYKESHQRVGRFSAWYWWNISIGGAIGMFIVDPLTGSEYWIDASPVKANLKKKSAGVEQ